MAVSAFVQSPFHIVEIGSPEALVVVSPRA